jgi:LysM domain
MSSATGRVWPCIASAASILALLLVVACVPQPAGRQTTPPIAASAYRVRSGDTITSIARKHDTTERSIGYWNRVTYPTLDPESDRYNPNDIRVGWTLLLIPGVEVDPDEITPPPTAPSAPSGSAGAGD